MVAPLLLGYNEILVNVTVSNIDVTGNILSKNELFIECSLDAEGEYIE